MQAGHALGGERHGGRHRGRALLRDVAPGKHHERLGGRRLGRFQRPLVGALEHGDLAPQSQLAQPRRVQSAEAERALGHAGAQALHRRTHPPADPTQVLAPVLAAPDLEPVAHDPVAPQRAHEPRREQREVGERQSLDDVVAAPAPQQVPEHAGAEHQRRQDAAPLAFVELHSWRHDAHVDALEVVELALPLAQRQVGDVVTGVAQAQGEAAIHTLGASDGVREEAVVDEADAHEPARSPGHLVR